MSIDMRVHLHTTMQSIPRDDWNRLAAPLNTPFMEWEWLSLLETSGSVCPQTGWAPVHLTIHRNRLLVAAAPLYIKSHSEGEFVFDFDWVDIAAQIGAPYYPKLIGMIPATPSVGYRFLIADGEDREMISALLLQTIDQICGRYGIHSVAFNYADPDWYRSIEMPGYLQWRHQSFEWSNRGYRSFGDYLAGFGKNQRRNIRRERQRVKDEGIEVRIVRGEEAPPEWFSLMYDYYLDTNNQFGPWAARYLTREFFEGLYNQFRRNILFGCAFEAEECRQQDIRSRRPLAMSLLAVRGSRLIGRYWGAARFVDCLHFNLCYYAPIMWAIDNGIGHFDPGIGSYHKIRRGFHAVATYSLHHFYDQRMQAIMSHNIGQINLYEQAVIDKLNAELPLKSLPAGVCASSYASPRTVEEGA